MSTVRYEALDGWRGIAAVSVALVHLSVASHFYTAAWIRHAGMFVDLFFVLSGFVICHAYLDKLTVVGMFGSFVIRRLGRLWPLHIITLSAMVVLELVKLYLLRVGHLKAGESAFTNETSPLSLLTNLLLIHSLGLHKFYTWNGPSWSISVEFWTYIVFGLLARHIRKYFVLAAIALVLFSAVMLDINDRGGTESYTWGILRCLMCFFTGALICRLFDSRPSIVSRAGWEWVAFALTYALVLAGDAINTQLLRPLVFGFLVLVFAHGSGTISRVLLSRPVQRLGLYSYSIYLVHFPILTVLNSFIRVLQQTIGIDLRQAMSVDGKAVDMISIGHSAIANDALAIAYLAVVCGTASLTYKYVEDPARRFFNKIARRRERQFAQRLNSSVTVTDSASA